MAEAVKGSSPGTLTANSYKPGAKSRGASNVRTSISTAFQGSPTTSTDASSQTKISSPLRRNEALAPSGKTMGEGVCKLDVELTERMAFESPLMNVPLADISAVCSGNSMSRTTPSAHFSHPTKRSSRGSHPLTFRN